MWEIESQGLALGRSADCEITVDDRTVSRRHCRVFRKGDTVHFEDLGSRNPALVNGLPCENGPLKPGDEVAVGGEVFLLTKGASPERAASPGRKEVKTIVLRLDEIPQADDDSAQSASEGRPRTVHDLAMLFDATRVFGGCTSIAELMEGLGLQLVNRFKPLALWVARVHGEENLTYYVTPAAEADREAELPAELIRSALKDKRGLLAPEADRRGGRKEIITTMVVPVILGDVNLAVAALQTESPQGVYREGDLTLLAHLAQSVAPFIHAVEDIERLRRDNEQLRTRAGESLFLVGDSRGMSRVRSQIAEAAESDLSALITGETGTGKELAARMLHAQSGRNGGPLIIVNCAAIPRDLFESVLFGYEKGAFTGAQDASVGLLAQAHGGTLFLDEVGDLSLDNEARILRAIEYGTFRRIGAKEESRVDMRVVSATNTDIPLAIKHGAFREDLYHRLNAFEIHIPPLRERPSDIPALASHFFDMAKGQAKRPLTAVAPEAMEYLRGCSWPGNVRELRNCVLRAIAVARSDTLQPDDFMASREVAGVDSAEEALSLAEAEKRHIASALERCRGNVRDAANLLQIGRSTLYKKILDYGIRLT